MKTAYAASLLPKKAQEHLAYEAFFAQGRLLSLVCSVAAGMCQELEHAFFRFSWVKLIPVCAG